MWMFHVKFMYSVLFMWISCENFMSILHETCFTWNSHAAILPKLFVVLLLYCCFSWCYIVTDSAVLLSYFPRRAPPRPSPCLSPGTVSRPSSISCTLTRPQVSQVTHLFWYLLSLKSEIPLRAFNYYLLSLSTSTHQRCGDANSWNIRLSCERLGVQIRSETDLSHENK